MITTRTRILSILATVAMLVSMLACFVIPASADESVTAPYQALIDDVGADKVPYLNAVIGTATDDATLAAELEKDVAAGTIDWSAIQYVYGTNDYPRYAHKAVYDDAGYAETIWSITEPADWTAMVEDTYAETPATFEGYTFHVTKDVDFDGVASATTPMKPLNLGNGVYNNVDGAFQGTIQGHNHAFQNIYVTDPLGTTGNRLIGMIGKLGDGAVIENFGVDSGKIVLSTANTRSTASTFGQGLPTALTATAPLLHNVWSGADIEVTNSTTTSAACGILAYSADTKGGPIVNGAYFFGSLTAEGTGTNSTYGILYNLRTGRLYNSLSNPETDTYALSLQSSSYSVVSNVYSVNHATLTDTAGGANVINNSGSNNVDSAIKGAWAINKAQPVKAHTYDSTSKHYVDSTDDLAPVYYTITEDGIRPIGDENNRIIKITVNNVDHYINKDTELSQDYVLGLAELETFTVVTVDGEETSFPLTAADEMEITVAADAGAALEAAWDPYKELSTTYLSAEATTAWLEASEAVGNVANAEEGTDTTELINTANGKIDALKTALADYGTYASYPVVDEGKAVPGYKDVELYGKHNINNIWTINSKEDWIAMVNASDYIEHGDDVETFENHIFHVTGDIDFDATPDDDTSNVGVKMAPLSLGNGTNNNATGAFQGKIKGYGHAFKNINVYDDLELGVNRVSGLIGKLGDGAVVEEFGVDSGTIELTGDNGSTAIAVATFGEGTPSGDGVTPQLTKVWSNATIKLTATTEHANKIVSGIIANAGDTSGGATINGAYFSGELLQGSATYGILYNLRTSHVYNALSNPKTATYALSLNSKAAATIKNIFGVDHDAVNVGSNTTVTPADLNCASVTSPEEGAWKINGAQVEDDIADVYFTLEGDDIRFGNVNNRIVKVTVNEGAEDEKEIYVNNATTLNKAYFADLYEVGEGAITITVGDSTDPVDSVTANGDTTVTVTVDYTVVMHDLWDDKYGQMDGSYLTATAAEKLAAVDAQVGNVGTDQELAKAAITAIGELEIVLKANGTYPTYPVLETDVGKAVPGYKDVELYGDYNTAHVWTINEPEDWTDMVRDSVSNDFKGYVFHVTQDVNFEKAEMLPLNYGDDALKDQAYYPFNGTIEGYGHAFKDINVQVTISNYNEQCATGMIGKLGQYAVINNFGVDSGTIHAIGDPDAKPARVYVATFGEPMNKDGDGKGLTDATPSLTEQYAKLNNVWSGADLIAEGAAGDANYASGIVNQAQNSYMVINGAYFYGTLQGDTLAGITENQTRVNVYNALNDNAGTAAMFVTTATNGKLNNVYSTRGNKVETTLNVKPTNTNQDSETGEVPSCTAEAAAWMLNNANVAAAAADGIAKVYFTLDDNDVIRFGEEANRIVKYEYTINGEEKDPVYANAGAAVNVATVLKLVDGAEYTVANDAGTLTANEDGTYNIEGDVTVTVTLDESEEQIALLTEKLSQYDLEKLNLDYFKTADEINVDGVTGKIGLKAFVEMALTALETNTGLAEAVAEIDNVVAEIKGAADYENLPAYKDHAIYDAYNVGKNWLIVDKADWEEMDKEANDAEGSTYFADTIFHLKGDIDFAQDGSGEEYTDYMWPLGSYGTRAFAGTINGHGYGFKNVYVTTFKPETDEYIADYAYNYVGLFARLDGATIAEFGINSGMVRMTSGNGSSNVSTFGIVNAEATVTFNKVWSGATLYGVQNAHVSALAAAYDDAATTTVNVNGFAFYGTVAKAKTAITEKHPEYVNRDVAYGIYGGRSTGQADLGSFSNIISNLKNNSPTIITTAYLLGFTDETAFTNASGRISNVYGLGDITQSYRTGTTGVEGADGCIADGVNNPWVYDMTEGAAAYAINNANTGAEGDVYFKLVDGNVRPTGTATNRIVEVAVTVGDVTTTEYINANQAYTNAELRDALGYGVETTITDVAVTSGDGTYAEGILTLTGDAAITLTIDVCEHTEKTYVHNGKNSHTATCNACGYEFETEACTKNWVAGSVDATTGVSTHTAVCDDCKYEYAEDCPGTLEQNTDCMQDDTWVFPNCEYHTGTYVATGTAEKEHNYGGWAVVEGTNKKCRECTNDGCDAKEYVIEGTVSATGIGLYCNEDGTITITLPEYLASADLTFSTEGDGYTITGVTGAEKDGDVYKVTGNGDVTVTIAADVTAVGGTFKVEVANAKDAEGTTIEFAGATATIGFTPTLGDANGDGDVNLADALAALYKVAQKTGAADINELNADVTEDGNFNIQDVYGIVREWLKGVLADA